MGKRIKPVASMVSTNEELQKNVACTNDIPQVEGASPLLRKQLSAEEQKKIDAFDALQNENTRLTEENSDIKDKLAEYIDEIDDLKKQLKAKPTTASIDSEQVAALKKEVAELKDANAKYLTKISELTFENAKMTSEIQTLKELDTPIDDCAKLDANPMHEEMAKQKAQAYRNVYRTRSMNGYSDWN